ncbi:hypothetical protein PENTCL1PPCAC_9291, partial [Pristionchus entomophagus]
QAMENDTLSSQWSNATDREKCAALYKLTNKTAAHSIFVYAQLLYVIPTMVYAKFLIAALICGRNRRSRYSSIFYSLIAMGAWTAVLIHVPRSIFELIGKRPEWFCPTFRALSQPTFWLDIYVYAMQVWDTLRILAGTMIVLYRFHSLLDVYSAKRVWESHKAAILIGTVAIPVVLYAPIWASPSYAKIDDEEMVFENEGLSWYNNDAVHCCICLVCAVLVLLSQAILLCLRTSTKLVGESIDRSLYVVGIVEIVVITIYTVFEYSQCLLFARDWFDRTLPSWILYVSLLVSDALGFCPPWALFITSQNIREDATPFRRLFVRCCRSRTASITPNESETKTDEV